MKGSTFYSLSILAVLIFFSFTLFQSNEEEGRLAEISKISLREVGNQLLLTNGDSTSLVLPVVEIAPSKFELSFQSQLSFEPSQLVSMIKESFEKSELPERYIVEVIQCEDQEVAYSYQMTESEQTTIIPCVGRVLPVSCYKIQLNFYEIRGTFLSRETISYVCAFAVFMLSIFYVSKNRESSEPRLGSVTEIEKVSEVMAINNIKFCPGQNKLTSVEGDINLSKKECELLTIFVANPNQVVTREELTKRVWEDNGVIVGRSLDTYISKLRTKLKSDPTVKLTNIHGVGYKLELRD